MTSLAGQTLRGRYAVARKIGEGAMSLVYLATDARQPGRRYALKVMRPELVAEIDLGRRFQEEGALLAELEHPGILRLHDRFTERGLCCMVLDYVEGRSLADALEARRVMPPEVALPMFCDILEALDFAHRAGILHRDIKPSNILIGADGRPLICDFGIARRMGEGGLTRVGTTLGTPQYMSPEQIEDPRHIDHRSDLYSAGVMLYEMLTGHVPFGDAPTESDFAVLHQQVHAAVPDPLDFNPALDDALCDLLARALRKDRDRRFQGALDFRRTIEIAVGGAAGGDEEDGAGDPPRPETQPAHAPAATPKPVADGPGNVYVVFHHPTAAPCAVKVGFNWTALCFGVGWMLATRHYGRALLWFTGLTALLGLLVALADVADDALLLLLAAAFGAARLLPALHGNAWTRGRLVDHGWVPVQEVRAFGKADALSRVRAPRGAPSSR